MSASKDSPPRRRTARGATAKAAGGRPAKAPWQIVEASFKLAAQATTQLPPQLGVELAFAGRSNVST